MRRVRGQQTLTEYARKWTRGTMGVLLRMGLAISSAWAGWTTSVAWTAVKIRQFTPDISSAVWFSLSSMPITGCPNNGELALSPTTVTDPQVLKNFLATLLTAKATGQTIIVGYDSGASCDPSGYPRIFELMLSG